MPTIYYLLGLLYLVQGFPYGLQSGLLPVLLRTQGLSLSHIGLARILYLPWLLKFLWSPFIDGHWSRRTWLLISTGGLAICSFLCSLLPLGTDFTLLAWLLLIMHFLSSLQDVVVDAVAVAALTQDEVGIGNSIQVVAYKFGSIIAGGGALTVLEFVGWRVVFILLAVMYFIAVLCAGFTKAIESPVRAHERGHQKPTNRKKLKDLVRKVLKVPGTSWAALYVLSYKLGEQGSFSMVPLLLLDHGITPAELGVWNGILSLGFSILGSGFGGTLLSRGRCLRSVLKTTLSLRLLCLLFQTLLLSAISLGMSSILKGSMLLTLVVQHFLAGVITTVTFSLMMRCTQQAEHTIQASHYSLLSSLEVLGKVSFGAVSGIVVDYMGILISFCVFAALSCLPLLHLQRAPPTLA